MVGKSWKEMEPIDEPSESSSFCRDEKAEAMDLLEECWFFDNLLTIKAKIKMSRSFSDPYPSTAELIFQDLFSKDSNSTNSSSSAKPPNSIQRAPSMPPIKLKQQENKKQGSNFSRSKLMRQPSDPTELQAASKICFSADVKESKFSRSKSMRQPSVPVVLQEAAKPYCAELKVKEDCKSDCSRRTSKLHRTPSLPSSIGREEKIQVNNTKTSRSPKHPSKSCSIPRSRPTRKTELESNNTESIKEMRRRFSSQKIMRKSLSDLENEEVQGFKDLGFQFEKETISPSVASILPGLREKNRDEKEQDKVVRRPYLSEAWLAQSCGPPLPPPPPPPPVVPNWASKKLAEDVKAQIKFWARAVASNVRQEC